VLVDRGTLRVGDPVVAGAAWGTVRALIDHAGEQIKEAPPSMPVQVLGLSDVPEAGDELRVAPTGKVAKTVAEAREQRYRMRARRGEASVIGTGVKLEDIFEQIQRGEVATLNMILKADVQGSLEALTESLKKLERDEVKLSFVHRGVGGITENDVQLAAASSATIIGFNVRPDRKARTLAEAEGVEVRTYQIIYQVLEDIENAMVGMLKPEFEEIVTGEAEVREIFRVPRVGAVAGCYVRSGVITRGSKVRFLRPRGAVGVRVRHRAVRLPGPQAGRRDRAVRGARDPTHVRSLSLDLRLHDCRSLKDKRSVVKSILQGAQSRFAVSAAEVADQDKWQRAGLGFAVVSSSYRHATEVLENVERFVLSFPQVDVLGAGWDDHA
jgi:uncharacterized protein YlxP (DUF503 family)